MIRSRLTRAAFHTLALTLLALYPVAATPQATSPAPSDSTPTFSALPPRADDAPTGGEFIRRIAGLAGSERESLILEQVSAGNIPDFLRRFRPVTLSMTTRQGKAIAATIFVTPDYLAIGSNEDFVRIPADYYTAASVARITGCTLPTRKMVNAIYRQAGVRLKPQPMKPGPQMASSAYYARHNKLIQQQLDAKTSGRLVAGQKKDIVLSNRLRKYPKRVAIYGWHRVSGEAIQPLSTVHGATYADYSHGVRLVSDTILINGQPRQIFDVFADPTLCKLLTDEGPTLRPDQLLAIRRPLNSGTVDPTQSGTVDLIP